MSKKCRHLCPGALRGPLEAELHQEAKHHASVLKDVATLRCEIGPDITTQLVREMREVLPLPLAIGYRTRRRCGQGCE
eukprot:9185402-Lingulodinium_polyedra.AAC.1